MASTDLYPHSRCRQTDRGATSGPTAFRVGMMRIASRNGLATFQTRLPAKTGRLHSALPRSCKAERCGFLRASFRSWGSVETLFPNFAQDCVYLDIENQQGFRTVFDTHPRWLGYYDGRKYPTVRPMEENLQGLAKAPAEVLPGPSHSTGVTAFGSFGS